MMVTRNRTQVMQRPRDGLTLIEVVVAMTLLGGVLLSLGGFSFRLAQSTGSARIAATASQLVNERLETIKGAPRYSAIDSLYKGTENPVAGYAGYTRQTLVQRFGGAVGDSVDYKIITVEVKQARLARPLRKTTVIAAY